MIYKHKITNQESKNFNTLLGVLTTIGVLPREFDTINEIWVECSRGEAIGSKWLGSRKQDFYKPYLAGKGDLIAFDTAAQIMVKYDVRYRYSGSTKALIIMPHGYLSLPEQELYPLLATLMHEANDIDVSDDNFRAWLIANRPKVNKMEKMNMHEDTKNDALFKFLQLREHGFNVKITQETGQALFAALFAHANAIAHEEVSGDGAPTDSAQLVLALVNNLISSAKPAPPKPAIHNLRLAEFINLSAEYKLKSKLPMISGREYDLLFKCKKEYLLTLAEKVFGEPIFMSGTYFWYVKIGEVVCEVFMCHETTGLTISFHRDTPVADRNRILTDIEELIKRAERE